MVSSLLLILGTVFLFPTNAPVHGQTAGTVCIIPAGSASCPSSPASIIGTVGTYLQVAVFIQNSAPFSGFDVVLLANDSILVPMTINLAGSVLNMSGGPPQIMTECIGGKLIVGNICQSQDTPDTLELGAGTYVGCDCLTSNPTTGLLFTAIYYIAASTNGTSIGFQSSSNEWCSTNSISGTTICVDIANGTPTPVPETIQAAVVAASSPPPQNPPPPADPISGGRPSLEM